MIIRYEFITKNCKFRKYNNGVIAINDKRTKATKQFILFCEVMKNNTPWKVCWTENATDTSCILALEI